MITFRTTMRRILLAAVIALMPLAAIAQDFQKGDAAYQAGDYATAIEEWRPLAEQGHAEAQNNLGHIYHNGLGVPQDYADAMRWYRLAANQGHTRAQVSLGYMYDNGLGVPQDRAEAMRWYRLAANQGFDRAQNNLGLLYAKVSRNFPEARRWFRLAAEQGHAGAQDNLGVMYDNGDGVPQNYVASYMWFHIALANGSERSRENRNRVARKMTPDQVREAKRRARVCIESNYKDCD